MEDLKAWAEDPLLVNTSSESDHEQEVLGLLSYPNKWYVHSEGQGCSCHFRHAAGSYSPFPPEFGIPEDWNPEIQDYLDATGSIHDILNRLIDSGNNVDLIDHWYGTHPDEIESLDVKLSEVSRDSFRFFANYKFTFST